MSLQQGRTKPRPPRIQTVPLTPKKKRKSPLRRIKTFFARLFGKGPKPTPPMSTRKPIIYVFTPTEVDVSIAVTLASEMEFTATYPIVPVRKVYPTGQTIQWNIHTSPDGRLKEQETGLELSSLFWEANFSQRHPRFSNNFTKTPDRAGAFIPAEWDLCDADSVVLPIGKVTPYLEKALAGLGLHTEARTSFITFWLPSFLKHSHIALRFIPQADYSRIAPLDISPEPDVVTRIFMLFKGVSDPEVWPHARRRALEDVSFWANVVGVDVAAALNKDLSRVLEWGAIDVAS